MTRSRINGATPSSLATLDLIPDAAPPPEAAACPECGEPYRGTRRRCYARNCSRSGCGPRMLPAARPRPSSANAPAIVSRQSSAVRELRAMRLMVEAMDALEPASRARVLAWVGSHYDERGAGAPR